MRFAVALMIAFVVLASRFGLETILGAFLAGGILGLVDRGTASHRHFRLKLEAIGYGFLVPVFFVASGVRLDLRALLANPSALTLMPLFLLALLLVRGLPALLYRHTMERRSMLAAALLQATSLPLIVTAVDVGMRVGQLTPAIGAALVSAGLLSVVLFPPMALGLMRPATAPAVPGAEAVTT